MGHQEMKFFFAEKEFPSPLPGWAAIDDGLQKAFGEDGSDGSVEVPLGWLGSMLIGSMGKQPPIYPIYK